MHTLATPAGGLAREAQPKRLHRVGDDYCDVCGAPGRVSLILENGEQRCTACFASWFYTEKPLLVWYTRNPHNGGA
jgi:hypothetical protein